MPVDPYHERLTPYWKIRQWLVRIWPTVYNVINHIFNSLVESLRDMVKSVYNSLRP